MAIENATDEELLAEGLTQEEIDEFRNDDSDKSLIFNESDDDEEEAEEEESEDEDNTEEAETEEESEADDADEDESEEELAEDDVESSEDDANAEEAGTLDNEGEETDSTEQTEDKPEEYDFKPQEIKNVEFPEDYENRLAGFEDKLAKLDSDLDDGTLTQKEYRSQSRAIERDRAALEKSQDQALWQAERNQEVSVLNWQNACTTFLDNNPEFDPIENEASYNILNNQVIQIANKQQSLPEAERLSDIEILVKAKKLANGIIGAVKPKEKKEVTKEKVEPKEKTKPVKKAKKPVKVQEGVRKLAATKTSQDEDPFARLDAMDPDSREAEIGKMSAAERDRYLRS